MCGIVGYVGKRSAQDVLLDGLEKLEYRGYDSAGVALALDGGIRVAQWMQRTGVPDESIVYLFAKRSRGGGSRKNRCRSTCFADGGPF